MNPNSTPPEGLCGRWSASEGEKVHGPVGGENGPQATTQDPDPVAALLDTISTALNAAGYWLPIDGKKAVAEALLQHRNDEAEKWRLQAARRAIDLGRAERTLTAIAEMAAEQITHRGDWGDGYRTALRDLQELLNTLKPKETT